MNSIFLIGPMGSGKSAVGRALARALDRDFLDSDTEIESRTGVDIAYIFEKEGESGFRRRETEIIDELTGRDDTVLATGGGAVLVPENREVLDSRGTVVYLHTTVEQQLKRTRRAKNRPLLETGDRLETLQSLMEVRDPLYRSIADIIVDTDGRSVAAVTGDIRQQLAGG